jgi:hypothetical protein
MVTTRYTFVVVRSPITPTPTLVMPQHWSSRYLSVIVTMPHSIYEEIWHVGRLVCSLNDRSID